MYGFELDRETVVEHEATRLLEAAEHALSGGSLAKLVDRWNAEGVPTKSGDGAWNDTTLRRMLLNEDLVPKILAKNVHDDLVRLFAPATERQHLGAPASHLLSGILVCECGVPMYTALIRDRDGSKHEVYRCRKSYGGRRSGCGKVSIRSDTAERSITTAVAYRVGSEQYTDAINARRAALLSNDVTVEQLDDMELELHELEAILGTRFGDQYRERYDTLKRAVSEATRTLSAAPELQVLMDLPQAREGWENAWNGWSIGERRHVLKLLLTKVVVKPVGKGVRFQPSRLDPEWKV